MRLPLTEITEYSELEGTHKDQQSSTPELSKVTHPWWPWHPAGVKGSTLIPNHLPHWPRSCFSPGCFIERVRTDFSLPCFRHCLGIDFLPLLKWIYLLFSGFSLFHPFRIFFPSHQIFSKSYNSFWKLSYSFCSGYKYDFPPPPRVSLAFLSFLSVSPCFCSLKSSECAFSEVCFCCGCEACCQLRSWEQEQGAVCGTTPSSAQPWGLQELWFSKTQRVLFPSLPVIHVCARNSEIIHKISTLAGPL